MPFIWFLRVGLKSVLPTTPAFGHLGDSMCTFSSSVSHILFAACRIIDAAFLPVIFARPKPALDPWSQSKMVLSHAQCLSLEVEPNQIVQSVDSEAHGDLLILFLDKKINRQLFQKRRRHSNVSRFVLNVKLKYLKIRLTLSRQNVFFTKKLSVKW